MLDLSQRQLLELWSELDDAYNGRNGFGGDTAEIYAFRLGSVRPMADSSVSPRIRGQTLREAERQAAASLLEVLKLFCKMRNCTVEIDGQPPADWVRARYVWHRAHIKVKEK